MTTFRYRAKTEELDQVEGTVEAPDTDQAALRLKKQGLYLVAITREQESSSPSPHNSSVHRFSKKELALFCRSLGQSLQAGIPLLQALSLLARHKEGGQARHSPEKRTSSPSFMAKPRGSHISAVAARLEKSVLEGMVLSDAMKQLPRIFPTTSVALIRAGEAGGGLEEAFVRIADYAQRDAALISRVQMALVYPLFILTVGAGTMLLLLICAVPHVVRIFQEMEQPIPPLTHFMLGLSRMIIHGGPIFLVGAFIFFWMIRRRSTRWERVTQWIGRWVGRLPVLRSLLSQADLARWTQMVGLLVVQGLPLTEALRLSQESLILHSHKTAVAGCLHDVTEGFPLSQALDRYGMGDPFLRTVVAVGETEGDVGRVFMQAAHTYEEQVNRILSIFGTLIEPILMLVVGLFVALIVFSMLMPIFQMSSLIR